MKKLLYKILKRDMIKKLSVKHGEQFIDDVMESFGMPTNLLYNETHKCILIDSVLTADGPIKIFKNDSNLSQ
jgi:hypothetical protein